MAPERSCLLCANYAPQAYAGWKPERGGDRFDLYDLRRRLHEKGAEPLAWPGRCHADPIAVEVRSNQWCGRWTVHELMVRWWHEFAGEFADRRELAALKEKLRAERARSVARFRLLRKRRLKARTPPCC